MKTRVQQMQPCDLSSYIILFDDDNGDEVLRIWKWYPGPTIYLLCWYDSGRDILGRESMNFCWLLCTIFWSDTLSAWCVCCVWLDMSNLGWAACWSLFCRDLCILQLKQISPSSALSVTSRVVNEIILFWTGWTIQNMILASKLVPDDWCNGLHGMGISASTGQAVYGTIYCNNSSAMSRAVLTSLTHFSEKSETIK